MGIALGVAAVGAAGAIGGGLLSGASKAAAAKKAAAAQQKSTEADAAEREKYSQQIQAESSLAEMNLRANEQAALNVYGALGSAGTYDAPSQYGGPLTSLAPQGLTGLNRTAGVLTSGDVVTKSGMVTGADVSMGGVGKYKGSKEWSVTDTISNPDQLAGAIESTSGFRTVSKMVADAEQMMNKSGPLWNELNNSVIGSIYQSSAAASRQAMEQASAMIAQKGGAARTGMNWVTSMRVQEGVNRDRTNTLWAAKLGLEQWTRENAMKVQSFAQAWTGNMFGIRDTYTNALNNLRTFWSRTWPAGAAQLNQGDTQMMVAAASSRRDAMIAASEDKINGAVTGLTGLTKGIMGGIGGSGGGTASVSSYGGSSGNQNWGSEIG